ncbi:hypothetical protein PoB_006038700 [Plakobranchus ocellatus]|uniref:Uncharacterized protein n=1 Tax=Plakobranchus ocellatus TaxID=259542 RepID=A0AAV4CPT4_9GAST|nr:hypothetical protein PoB_006038700 [Plakobranchus ocellatus]
MVALLGSYLADGTHQHGHLCIVPNQIFSVQMFASVSVRGMIPIMATMLSSPFGFSRLVRKPSRYLLYRFKEKDYSMPALRLDLITQQ